MGDGGVIMQLRGEDGATVAVTNADWSCLVTHMAPIQKTCESEANPIAGEGACAFEITDTPADWDDIAFDATDWPAATEHSAQAVRPKDGYDRLSWDDDATFIWGSDLETDNTVLCRFVVE